ncbi:MAG: hypothetical protein J6V24_08555, partial [Clostridia bacterium]|nr:hypothetical protein [Clostridia bacterium]
MANKRSNKGSGFLAALLVIIDLGLLVWIGMSWYAQREAEPTDESPDTSYAMPTDSGDSISYAYEPDAESADDSAGSLDDWILGTPGGQTSQPESPPQDGASRFGSVGRPQTSDSQTWYEQIIAGSIPSDARLLTDFREVTGEWKGLICYSTED